jgi:hypothetical protein
MNLTLSSSTLTAPPSLNVTLCHRLTPLTTAYIDYDTGLFNWDWTSHSSPIASIGINREKNGFETDVRVSAEASGLAVSISSSKYFEKTSHFGTEVKINSSVEISSNSGPHYVLGFSKVFGDYGMAGFQVDSSGDGIILKIK